MYPGCNFYGIKQIFLEYAGLPTWLPFPVAVQHGWYYRATTFESSSNPPEIWVWSDRIANDMEQFYPREKIRVVGSFFYYFLENKKHYFDQVKAKGSILLPTHSSHFVKTLYSIDEFAKNVSLLSSAKKPITTMLYYLDMNDASVSEYKKYDFDVVTNGSLYSIKFIENFYNNIKDKEWCIYSAITSGVFYSKICGLKLHHIPTMVNYENNGDEHTIIDNPENMNLYVEKILADTSDGLLKDEMGQSYIINRADLRKLILRKYLDISFLKMYSKFILKNSIKKILIVFRLIDGKKTFLEM